VSIHERDGLAFLDYINLLVFGCEEQTALGVSHHALSYAKYVAIELLLL